MDFIKNKINIFAYESFNLKILLFLNCSEACDTNIYIYIYIYIYINIFSI